MEKLKVLVIDDEADIRAVLKEILEEYDYHVQTSEDGLGGLEILSREHIDIAIIDIGLPDMDGNKLLKTIKHDYPRMICIQVTGQATVETAIEGIHHGADGYFMKPIIFGDLVNRLNSILLNRHMQQEIEQLRELPRKIIDSVNEQIAIINVEDYRFISVNNGFLKAIGLTSEEVVGKVCKELTSQGAALCSAFSDGSVIPETVKSRSHQMVEHLYYDGDNNPCYCEISASPLQFGKDGSVTQVVLVARDITERMTLANNLAEEKKRLLEANKELSEIYEELKKSQAHVIQQEKMASIGQLAAGVAHEINNPMGFISSNLSSLSIYVSKVSEYVQNLESTVVQLNNGEKHSELEAKSKKLKIGYILEDLPELIKESLEGAERVNKIVQNMKVFSRQDTDTKEKLNINNCLESTLNILWNELKYKTDVTKDFGDVPNIMGFPQQLNQVFMNIIMNAVQAIEDHGGISIKTSCDEEEIVVAITDNGCGIAEANQKKIFEPFFTTKEAGKGTGLGMNISMEIIQKHDGIISFETEQGKGTTFKVSLPVLSSAAG